MAKSGLGVTIGSHSLRAVAVVKKGAQWAVTRAWSQRLEESLRNEAGRVLASKGFRGVPVTLGLEGRDVIIRYNAVPPVPDWRLRNLMKFEVMEVSGQSGGEVSADYRKLNLPDPDGNRGEDTVLVCLARNAYLLPLLASLEGAGLKVAGGCPRSVALFSAFSVNATYREDETALLVHVGAQGLDLAIQRGGELLFARSATPGGLAFTQAVATAFATTEAKAETLKTTKGDVSPRGQVRYADSTAEKVANAMTATAGQVAQLIQSTLMIGRAQTKLPDLKIDRVLLAGGGASLKGLDAYLKHAMGVPVERFNPFEGCDLSGLPEDERAALEAAPHEFAAALGLAQTPHEPAAFRLEVLPEAVRRKRDFATKGVFAVAAAAVAASGLFLLWSGRKDASAEVVRQASLYRQAEERLTKAPHRQMVDDLARAQEAREKHRRLAQLGVPGVLLSDTLALLADGMGDHPEVFLEETSLLVDDPTPSYFLLHPKGGNNGGFQTRAHTRHERSASVKVVGRVSEGPSPEKVFNEFVAAVRSKAPGRRLVVVTKKTYQARERKFELEVLPGVTLRPKGDLENASPWRLRGPELVTDEGAAAPTAVRGTTFEGLQVTVPKDDVNADDWKALVETLPAAAAKPAGGS
ncbi:MAG: pilus assembly protein PilM [Planctomycetes bacterium]|nr:pilus assembly protein PilM [Planctomycetota bacterium]